MKLKFLYIILLASFQLLAQNNDKSVGFIENKGQITNQKGKQNKAVKYLLNTNGLNVQLRKNGFSYDVYETKKHPLSQNQREQQRSSNLKKEDTSRQPNYTLEYIYHRIDIDFVNGNTDAQLLAEGKSTDYDNYYNVSSTPNGVLDVHKFQRITYQNIYPNIDAIFFIPDDKSKPVEYNFVVKQGGKIADIQLKFRGTETELADNKIKMSTRFGEMEETLPMSWIQNGDDKKTVAIGYRKVKSDVYGFETSENLTGKKVVIDPVPIRLWGTYYPGATYESDTRPHNIISDSEDNVIITGESYLNSGIATSGSFQSTNIVNDDTGFVVKLDSNGGRLWGTYINYSRITDIKVNSLNEFYIVGYGKNIGSGSLSTPGSYKDLKDSYDGGAILLKFNSNGQRIWGTFYGGEISASNGYEIINTISLDNQENIVIAGESYSTSGIATSTAYQKNNNNYFDGCGFIAKFTADGIRTYGSYFPGIINYSAIDSNNNLIFAGQYSEYETPNITTTGAYQNKIHFRDGFIVKFNSTGEQRLWCTYYGGDASFYISVMDYYDQIRGLGIDSSDNIYIVGLTNSTNLIATKGAYKTTQIADSVDSFIAKFNPSGQIQWGTYFGSDVSWINNDYCRSGFVSPNGNVFITGNTWSEEDIATPNSYQSVMHSGTEGFMTKFNTNGEIEWSTYYGSLYGAFPQDIFEKDKNIYIIGHTGYSPSNSLAGTNYFGTPGTYQPIGVGLFIAKFQDCLSSPQATSNNPCIDSNLNLTASGGTNYSWSGPNGFNSILQNPTIPNAKALHSGKYSCAISGTGGCDRTVTINVLVGDKTKPVPNISTLLTITGDCKTIISTTPTAIDNCAGILNATTSDPTSYSLPGTYTIHWKYNDGNGNIATQDQTVIISSQPLPSATSNQSYCTIQKATINDVSITGQNIKWYDASTNGTLLANTTALQNGITYHASQTINGCESERIPVLINLINTSAPSGNASQSFCVSQNPTIKNIEVLGTAVKWYDNAVLGTVLSDSKPLVNGATYYTSQTLNNCESPNRLAVTVNLIDELPANDFVTTLCDDLNDGSETTNLDSYKSNIIANPSDYSFKYYTSLSDAENDLASIPNSDISNYKLKLGENTIYIRVTFNNNCSRVVALKLTVIPSPIINLQDTYNLCQNDQIVIKADPGFDSYLWSTGETSSIKHFNKIGNYALTVTQKTGSLTCSSNKNFQVVLSNAATISKIETHDWSDTQNKIKVFAKGAGDYEYSIDGIRFQDSDEFTELHDGLFTVTVRDKNGCGSVTDEVYLLMYPKLFTPNGDGYNDTWSINYAVAEPELKVVIYDRYGKLIKQFDHKNDSWDGRYNGNDLLSDDYWFVVTRKDGKEYKGHFALKR